MRHDCAVRGSRSRRCMSRCVVIVLASLASVFPLAAQASLYTSVSSGYHGNPLYNYLGESDQLRQLYVEAGYRRGIPTSLFDLRYVGGYVRFNRFADRTYYEHSVTLRYDRLLSGAVVVPGANATAAADPEGQEDGSDEDEEEAAWSDDGRGTVFALTVRPSARHDRAMYKEFDNAGVDVTAGLRTVFSDRFAAAAENIAGIRHYPFLTGLSNMSEQVRLRAGILVSPSAEAGVQVTAGFKDYFLIAYDTSRFEETESYSIVLTNVYKGKQLIRVDTSYESSGKTIVKRPSNTVMFQAAPGVYGSAKWDGGNIKAAGSYRFNSPTSLHSLVANIRSLSLNEDLYNDHFSYAGPDVQIDLYQILPLNVQFMCSVDWSARRYEHPAFDLAGVEAAAERRDTRSSAEIYIARSFPVSEHLSIECAVGMSFMRNASNDAYNDYSLSSVSFTIGAGI